MQASSGFQQVGPNGALTPIIMTNLPVNSSGYLYIYTSNATPNVDVFFDNLQVTHTRGPLLEEDHYYPFGLTMAGISDKAVKSNYAENNYRFNGGNELQNKEFSDGSGLELYDATHRMYDPQIGRFWKIDRFAEITHSSSPYSFVLNNPILFNDPLGDTTTYPAVYVTALSHNSLTYQLNQLNFAQIDAWVGMMMTRYHHSGSAIDNWAHRNRWLNDNTREWIMNGTSDASRKYRASMEKSWKAQGKLYKFFLISAITGGVGEGVAGLSAIEDGALTENAVEEGVEDAGEDATEGAAAETSINSSQDLLNNVKLDGKVLKNGEIQGEIEGDAGEIESSVAKDATQVEKGQYKLNDGTTVKFYQSTKGGGSSMQINTGGSIYKVRIK